MKKIVITNDKGGVGKTTTVTNLAVGLSRQGYKTLVVDMDPQADSTRTILGIKPPQIEKDKPLPKTVYTMLLEHHDLKDVRVKAPRYEHLYILPSNSDLSQASNQLAQQIGAQTILYQILEKTAKELYDYILIDTGKGLDTLVINAIAAADEVIVITSPGMLELEAVQRTMKHVEKIRERSFFGGERPKVSGILLTNADRFLVTQDTVAHIEEHYPGLLFQTIIPKNDDLKKAISGSVSIFEFRPQSKGGQAYEELVKEVTNGK
jgi:chromosome partitioning protein